MSWTDWQFGPPFVGVLLVSAVYLRGYRALQGLSRRRTGTTSGRRRRDAALFGTALGVILIAVQSPLDAAADISFAAHMVQHLLLLVVAPPLIVLGAPWTVLLCGLPKGVRTPVVRFVARSGWTAPVRWVAHRISRPVPALILLNANLWAWHIPAAYDETLRNAAVHDTEHLLFLSTGVLFALQLYDSRPFKAKVTPLGRVVPLLCAIVPSWILAMVLTYASAPLYPVYAALPHRLFGMSALNDQGIGAAIMWVPGMLPYSIAILASIYGWLGREEEANSVRQLVPAQPSALTLTGAREV